MPCRSGGRSDRSEERVREREEQREADADERDRVEKPCDDEHLHLQRRGEFRLARRAFQELAAEQAEADGGTESAETEDEADAESGEALNLSNFSNVFHVSSNKNQLANKYESVMRLVRLRQVHDGQDRENECLQRYHQDVEHRPHRAEHELSDCTADTGERIDREAATQNREQQEDDFAGIEVAEQTQRERDRARQM